MRCHPLRWLWGLPLVLMWFWITFLSEQGPIKDDLQHRARLALEYAGHGWAVATFDGRDGVLGGRAVSVEGRENAEGIVRDLWGVRVVDNRAVLLDHVEDYAWAATTSRDGIVLTGHVPNKKAHATVIKYVKADFPNVPIDDQLMLARGSPEERYWLGGIRFGLHQLRRLTFGRLELNQNRLSLSGEARSYLDYKDVRNALAGQLPRGIELASDNVSPPIVSPYAWSAVREGRQLVLAGHVPSEAAREVLFERAKKQFPEFAIIDRMETAAGAQKGWADVTGVLVEQLASLDTGKADVTDNKLMLEGHAESEEIADRVRASVEDVVSDSFETTLNITFPEPKPPIISPFVSSIDLEKSRLRLFGYVPSEEARVQFVRFVRSEFPNLEIVDDLVVGSGAPSNWFACLQAGVVGVQVLGEGQIRMSDEVLKVIGTTDEEDIAAKLPGRIRAAANRACEVRLDVKLNLPPEPDLNWSAVHDGQGLVSLDGEVPDGDTREQLVRAAQQAFPEGKVIDQMTVVPGYAGKWQRVSLMGVGLLKRLRKGAAVVAGNELLIRGESSDSAIAGAIRDQLENNLARGYVGRAEIEVRSDAMIWAELEAKRRAERSEAIETDDTSRATSTVERDRDVSRYRDAPTIEVEDDAARRRRRNKDLEEQRLRSERAAAERDAWSAERRRRAEELKRQRAREEEARLVAVHERRERQARRRIKADKCQDALRTTASEGVIRFAFASHKLKRSSFPTLNSLVSVAKSCPSFVIEISGHTDSKGSEDRNMTLSKRRAQSVVDYLVGAGVTRERLEAVGYGETQPVAPNTTSANRAKNRRIEFIVRDE